MEFSTIRCEAHNHTQPSFVGACRKCHRVRQFHTPRLPSPKRITAFLIHPNDLSITRVFHDAQTTPEGPRSAFFY